MNLNIYVMKHIKKLKFEKVNESKLSDSKRQLKYFRDELDLDVTIEELMKSIKATNLDLKRIYPNLTGKEKMSSLPQNEKFVEHLNKLELKLGEFQDSENFETFSRLPLRWYWIYTEDDSEISKPVQIMFRYFYNNEWSDIKLYMVNDVVENFYDELSLVTIEINSEVLNSVGEKETKRWFYTTSDSGKSWLLQTNPKQIKEDGQTKTVKSNQTTPTFKKSMSWGEILHLSHNTNTKLIIY